MRAIAVGTIAQIGPVEAFGENGFVKQEVVIKTVEEFPQVYNIEFTKGNIELAKDLEVGQNVKITIRISGREYTNDEGKKTVFHSLNAWKVESI